MRQVKKGSTNVSVELYILDSTDGTPETGVLWNTAGIDLNYRRDGAVVTSITEATLAALTTAHTDGGFLEIGNGRYRFDIPDAAFASGVSQVTVGGTVTGMVVVPVQIQLVDFDPDDVTRLGLTSLPNAAADAAGGLAISDAGGLDLDAILSDTNAILVDTGTTLDDHLTDIKGTGFVKDTHSLIDIETYVDLIDDGTSGLAKIATDVAAVLVDTADIQPKLGTISDLGGGADVANNLADIAGATFSTSTDSLEAIRDRGDVDWSAGEASPALIQSTTIATVTSQTEITLTAGSTDDDAYAGNTYAIVVDQSTATQKTIVPVTAYTGSTKTVTFGSTPVFTIATGDTIYIVSNEMGTVDANIVSSAITIDANVVSASVAAAENIVSVSAGRIVQKRANYWSFSVTGLGSLAGITRIIFSAASEKGLGDANSWVQIDDVTGLLVIDGGVAATAANGLVTIDDADEGDITVVLEQVESEKLDQSSGVYDIKVTRATGIKAQTLSEGVFAISDVVAEALT